MDDAVDTITFTLECFDDFLTAVDFYYLILMPIDEWACDATDVSFTGIEKGSGGSLERERYGIIDGIEMPKTHIRALIREEDDDDVIGVYRTISSGQPILQASTNQRLWFHVMRWWTSGGEDWLVSSPFICATVQLARNQRYLSMRGDR